MLSNYFDPTNSSNENTLHLSSSKWQIDGTAVSASATQLNSALNETANAALAMTWGSAFTTPVSAPLKYSKVGSQVLLTLPTISGTAVGATKIVSQSALPVAIRPAAIQNGIAIFNNGTTTVAAKVTIGTDGIITIGSDLTGANISAASVSVVSSSISYTTA